VGEILCAHNLWVSNTVPAQQWSFLTVIYPAKPGEDVADIERLDDSAVRIAGDVIAFGSDSRHAKDADFVVDVSAMRPE